MPLNTKKLRLFILTLVGIVPLIGCSSLEFPWVYKISVQQGNILDPEDINKLELGMTKRQVQFVMGSPLLADTFNQDRWDYYYSRRSGKGKIRTKQLTIHFENDVYVRHSGDTLPVSAEEKPAADTTTEEQQVNKEALKASKAKKAAEF